MKFFLTIPVFIFFTLFSQTIDAQRCSNYTVNRTTGVTYTSIQNNGTSNFVWRNTTGNQNDDNRSFPVFIGFDFWYLGIRYNMISASLNGTADFSSSTEDGNSGGARPYGPNYNNWLSTANGTHLALAPMYDDLWTGGGGTAPIASSLIYKLSGNSPNRVLTIEWINFDEYSSGTGSINFQIKLYETTGVIEFIYGTMSAGSQPYVYACGISNTWTFGSSNATRLLTQQIANSASFGSAGSNSLSILPMSNSILRFSPPTPSAAPTSLTFTGITKTGMTLNWTDHATNEIGYVIYNSTDNVNFNMVSQTAANITTSVISGLLTNTTYYWKVYAVTEGKLSAALTGQKATLPAGTITAKASANWNQTATWDCNCIPTAGDDVIIPNNFVVTLRSNQDCNSLTIGGGSSGTLKIGNNGTGRTLTVNSNMVINPGGTLITGVTAATHQLNIGGNIVNNGTLDLYPTATRVMNITFNKNGNQQVSGTGSITRLNRISLDMGTSATNILDITASNFTIGSSNFLTLLNGTFKLSAATVNITPFTSSASIPLSTGIWINHPGATMTSSGGSISLYGYVRASAGILNIGSAVNHNLISYGGEVMIDGGTVNVKGCLTNGGPNIPTDFSISSGTFKVAVLAPTIAGEAPFKMDQLGSTFNMSGGTIIIGNPGVGNSGYLNTGSSGTVSAGTLQMGDASTPAGSTMQINTTSPVGSLVVSNGAAITSQLIANPVTIINDVTINAGVFNGNSLNINFGGNWINNGTFIPGTGTVTLNGLSNQTITKAGGEGFYSLVINGSNTKTLGSDITVNNDINIYSALDVSNSNFSISCKRNWVNEGTFIPRAGTVIFNGSIAQQLSGTGSTTFNNLTINNNAGVTLLSGNYMLEETLTLSNGTFNTSGNQFTMISTASKTARIAPVTGTGGVNGNFIIQRYIPNRFPSWSDFSSPVVASSMNDWANELFLVYDAAPSGDVYSYSEPLADYTVVNSGTTLTPGKGFEIYLSDDETISTFTERTLTTVGVPNIGTQVIPIIYTAANGVPYAIDPINGYAGENLVGNPFASAIDLSALSFSPEVLPTVDVFDNTTQSYVTLSGNALIGPHQGFWAYTSGTASGTITITEASKSPDLNSRPNFLPDVQPYFELTMSGSDSKFSQTLKVACNADASDGWDKKDAPFRKSRNYLTPVIAGYADIPLSITTFNSNHKDYLMPLMTSVSAAGSYEITTKGISFVDNVYPCVRLKDKLMNKMIDLHKEGGYVFHAEPTDDNTRFILCFSTDVTNCNTDVTNIKKNNFITQIKAIQTENGNTINFNLVKQVPVTISLINTLGQNLVNKELQVKDQSINIDLPTDFHGIYYIRIVSANNNITKKFYR